MRRKIGVFCLFSAALGMAAQETAWQAKWIWCDGEPAPRNFHLCARREFVVPEDAAGATLRITADTRYVAYINGVEVGRGPIRSWPAAYHYDTYDLTGKLAPGANVVAVIVKHPGISTFQSLVTRGGLLAEVGWTAGGVRTVVPTDASWQVMPHSAFSRRTPRFSCQMGWVEHFDARLDAPLWRTGGGDASLWQQATVVAAAGEGPWTRLVPRPIPPLTLEPVYPVRVTRSRLVIPPAGAWSFDLRPNLLPGDREANPRRLCGLAVTTVTVPADMEVIFHHRNAWTGVNGALRVNGKDVRMVDDPWAVWLGGHNNVFTLRKGTNLLVWDVTGTYHEWSLNFGITAPMALEPRAPAPDEGAFVTFGPFDSTGAELFQKVWNAASPEDLPEGKLRLPVAEPHVYEAHVFHLTAWAKDAGRAPAVDDLDALCAAIETPAVIQPSPEGHDTEVVLDFGRMTVGLIEFSVEAQAGTVLDFLGFEGMQEGRWQLPSEMANVLRYTCRDGYQTFRSTDRRGFRYLIMTVRNLRAPLRIFSVRTLLNTYPVVQRGEFHSSDERLNAIWRMGAYTTRLCSEDTFVDCPTYEQAFWVGDARNAGAVSMVAFGNTALLRHSLTLAAQSLDRSPIVESQVPSGWLRLLTAWSLLWALACEEYFQYSADLGFVTEIYPRLAAQAAAFAGMRNERGLLFINAWNMLDWAGMDTPDDGIVTHQNALLVESWRRTARLARVLGKDEDAARYLRWAGELKEAINRFLWHEERKAYVDAIRADGTLSPVISQQTNVMVYLADCATDERRRIIAPYVSEAPEGFVTVGSPFMMFFVFEALARMGDFQRILDLARVHWGFMLDAGATTCWETFPVAKSYNARYWTRSHCHAWSAAPTYFLSAYQLGVLPRGPGYRTALIAPKPADLAWARGSVPTPYGDIRVAWTRAESGFTLNAELPDQVRAEIELPPEYGPARYPHLTVTEGKDSAKVVSGPAGYVVSFQGRRIALSIGKEP